MLATAPDSVPYYYGFITRENAELILWDRGCLDGMYLLRASHNRDAAYVLSVCQNKQVLHYRIIKDSNGMHHLHGLPLDKHVGPIEVLEKMHVTSCKLVIPCLKPLNVFMPGVNCGMTDDKLKEALQKKAIEWGIQESELNVMLEDKENDVWKLILKTLHESESWFHGKISREEAEKNLARGEHKDGKFLVRERNDRSFSLSLCHNQHVKHYKIDVLPSSEVGIQDGPRFENLISLVSHYSVFSDGLWCCLQYPCINLALDFQPGSSSSTNISATSPDTPSSTVNWPLERRNSNSDLLDDATVAGNSATTLPELISDSVPPAQPAFPLNRPIFSPIAESRNGSVMLASINNQHQQQNPGDTSLLKFMMSKLGRPIKPSSEQNSVKQKPVPPPKTISPGTAGGGSYRLKSSASQPLADGESSVQPSSVFYKQLNVADVDKEVAPATSILPNELAPVVPTKIKPHRTPPMVPRKRPSLPTLLESGTSLSATKLTPPSPMTLNVAPTVNPSSPPDAFSATNNSFRTASARKLTPPPPPPLSAVGHRLSARKLTPPPPPPLSACVKSIPPPVPAKKLSVSRCTIIEDEAEGEQSVKELDPSSDDVIPISLHLTDKVTPTIELELPAQSEICLENVAFSVAEIDKSADSAPVELRLNSATPMTNEVKPLPRPRRNLPIFQKLRNTEQFVETDKTVPIVSPADRHSSPAAIESNATSPVEQHQPSSSAPFDFSLDTSVPDTLPPAVSPSISLTTCLRFLDDPSSIAKVREPSLSPPIVGDKPFGDRLSSLPPMATPTMSGVLAELKIHPVMNAVGSASVVESDARADSADSPASVDVVADDQTVMSDNLRVSDMCELETPQRLCEKAEFESPIVEKRLSRVSSCEPQYEEIDPDYASHKDNENTDLVSSSALSAINDGDECDLDEPQQESLVNEFVEECKWDDSREDATASSGSSNRSFQRKPPWTKEESELHFNTIKRHRTGPMAINRQYLQFQEKLGLGNFGDVMKATFKTGKEEVPCAVKMLRKNNMSSGKESIMREARIMTKLDHPHIVRLLGVSEGEPFYLVMELAPLGPLSIFLKRNPNFAIDDVLPLMKQVCQGMQYLESKQFVHRDLAARNVLLVNEGFVKISDFGMSKALGLHTDYYTVEPQGKLPLKWYAPECIYFFKFSTKSDVWSYGITLWEAMSGGVTPYQGMTGREILKMFGTNRRLGCPSRCPQEVYAIMTMCWEFLPEDRPSFSELLTTMTKQVQW